LIIDKKLLLRELMIRKGVLYVNEILSEGKCLTYIGTEGDASTG
jgi:hypothetical protein